MFILTKTNYQDFNNNVEKFDTLKDAQDAMQSYFSECKETVEALVGDGYETDDDVTLFIDDDCATARCDEFWMEYQIYDFSTHIDGSESAK